MSRVRQKRGRTRAPPLARERAPAGRTRAAPPNAPFPPRRAPRPQERLAQPPPREVADSRVVVFQAEEQQRHDPEASAGVTRVGAFLGHRAQRHHALHDVPAREDAHALGQREGGARGQVRWQFLCEEPAPLPGRPGRGAVEVTERAGLGHVVAPRSCRLRALDPVGGMRLQQAVDHARHVAGIAIAAGARGIVPRVPLHVPSHRLVALNAASRPAHLRLDHPLGVARVGGVAREAREVALVVLPGEEHALVLVRGQARRAVPQKRSATSRPCTRVSRLIGSV